MTDFATKFSEAKSSEELTALTCDVIRENSGGIDPGISPMLALIHIASEMAVQCSARQRASVAAFLRTSALSVEAGAHINHQPTTTGNIIPLKGEV
jgi:hypothetical protein